MQISEGGEGKERRQKGEPETLFNGEDIEGQMDKREDFFFCYKGSFLLFLHVSCRSKKTPAHSHSKVVKYKGLVSGQTCVIMRLK